MMTDDGPIGVEMPDILCPSQAKVLMSMLIAMTSWIRPPTCCYSAESRLTAQRHRQTTLSLFYLQDCP
jgi:hypothetical protein